MANPIYSLALANVRKTNKLKALVVESLETIDTKTLKGADVLLEAFHQLYLAANTASDSEAKQRLATEAKSALASLRTTVQRESLEMFDVKIGAKHYKKTGETKWQLVVAQKSAKRDILTTLGKTLDNDDALSDAMLEQIAQAVQSIVSSALDQELSNVIEMAA
jgi:hypothetical protein